MSLSFAARLARRASTLFLAVLLCAPVAFAGEQDFTLVNRTGVDIYELYVAPSDQTDWEEDVLGADILADGDSVHVTFSSAEDSELWDIKVVDGHGNDVHWLQVDLTSVSRVTLYQRKGRTWAETE